MWINKSPRSNVIEPVTLSEFSSVLRTLTNLLKSIIIGNETKHTYIDYIHVYNYKKKLHHLKKHFSKSCPAAVHFRDCHAIDAARESERNSQVPKYTRA